MSKISPSAADAAADKSVQDHPLLLLALRCEREEPSRELDCRIQAAFDDMAAERLRDPSATFNAMGIHTEGKTWAANYSVLRYTTSLDAAVTLVPKGMLVENWSEMRDAGHLTGKWLAQLSPRGPRRRMQGAINVANLRATLDADPCCYADTPALALCAAALRARAAMATDSAAARTSSEASTSISNPSNTGVKDE